MQQPTTHNDDAGSASHVPAARRWGALLLGALLFLPAGVIVLTTSVGPARWLGAAMIAFALYLAAGAFAPRLLRFGGPAVPAAAALMIVAAALQFADGEPLWGAFCLVAAAGFLAHARTARARHGTSPPPA